MCMYMYTHTHTHTHTHARQVSRFGGRGNVPAGRKCHKVCFRARLERVASKNLTPKPQTLHPKSQALKSKP